MIAAGVDDDRSVADGIAKVAGLAGRIDAVVNNAGTVWMGARAPALRHIPTFALL